MRKRKLPTGIQTFRKVREEGCYYVDKTAYIHRLVSEGTHYFLSRPRRFGKSLFVDTLKELFEGSEALFKGLHVHDRWDWSVRHPVVRLSFAAGSFDRQGALEADFADQMARLERLAGVSCDYATPHRRLAGLIEALHAQTGHKVVVLVDECDRPITDALGDPTLAKANRSFLRGVYGVVKDADALIALSFFTGVTKFSKVSLFSDLNNLTDITLDPSYAAICGYTDDDLDTVFAPELEGLDRKAVRDWYDGYRWLGDASVYNPWAILLLFKTRRFKAHWFETGTPAFLVQTLVERRVGGPALESEYATEELLSAFDVDEVGTEALLFQTGYLTIVDEIRDEMGVRYRLGCPNREVRQSLNTGLLRAMSPDGLGRDKDRDRLRSLLGKDDLEGVEQLFRAFFAGIPTTGTGATTSRASRGTTPASSTRTSLARGWMSQSRRAPAEAVWTWRFALASAPTCSSSRWSPGRATARPCASSSRNATRTSTVGMANQCVWSASSSARRNATSSASTWSVADRVAGIVANGSKTRLRGQQVNSTTQFT